MTIQVLVAAVQQNVHELAAKMNLETETIIINQDENFSYEEFTHKEILVKAYTFAERGVGLSRNNALLRADSDLVLFADEDIVLNSGYVDIIRDEFANNPKADIIIFNIAIDERRATYKNTTFKRVRWYNYGRYGACGIVARTNKLHEARVTFSLLFGGGALYSNGEDSLFLHDCLKKGLKIYASPRNIGYEEYRDSTWFKGYNIKFFFDRGVLYRRLYGLMAKPLAYRFLYKNQTEMCRDIPLEMAYFLMKKGIES